MMIGALLPTGGVSCPALWTMGVENLALPLSGTPAAEISALMITHVLV